MVSTLNQFIKLLKEDKWFQILANHLLSTGEKMIYSKNTIGNLRLNLFIHVRVVFVLCLRLEKAISFAIDMRFVI